MARFISRLLLFGLLSAISYVGVLFAIANSPATIRDPIGRSTNAYPLVFVRQWAHAGGDALLRFREINNYKDVDVLFVGSSHTFRSFDPRIFRVHGLSAFNMGSRAQTPLNSYYLLKKHIKRLNPRLIVFETYYEVFGRDGLESLLELVENLPLDSELWRIAWATKNIRSINAILIRILERGREPVHSLSVSLFPQDTYIEGGYLETQAGYQGSWRLEPHHIDVNTKQFEYLGRVIRLAKESGSRIVLVAQPLPRETREKILNRSEVSRMVAEVAKAHDVDYIDFNERSILEENVYYIDYHHLGQNGVNVFNAILISELRQRRLLISR